MATPKIIADFETQLATAIAVGGTSFTLATATDDDGNTLPDGLYYFTVENGSSNKEYLAGTLTASTKTVASVVNVSRQGTETSGADKAHRVGASVIISDWMTYKKYMDEISLVSAPDANANTKGVVEEATTAEIDAGTATGGTGAELFVAPDALSTSIYKTQLPSSDEKAALAGDLGTPSTTVKYLTASNKAQVVTFTGSGTWTKDTGLQRIRVQAWGGGGSGGCGSSSDACGGGGGGYAESWFEAGDLGATETVTVGAGGAAQTTPNSDGNAGANTTFGSLLTAYGGAAGGRGASGVGGNGGGVQSGDGVLRGAGGNDANGGSGILFGGAGGGGAATVGYAGGSALWGGAGGGGGGTSNFASGGTSIYGGNGGAGATNGSATAGSTPAGGGGGVGGSSPTASGAGGDGKVIVTEYYL